MPREIASAARERIKGDISVPIRLRLRSYFMNRLALVMMLWAGIGFTFTLGPKFMAFIQAKDAVPIELSHLDVFADVRLPIVLLFGTLTVRAVFFILSRFVNFDATTFDRVHQAIARCWDDVSAALTHFACAACIAQIINRQQIEGSALAIFTALLFGLILYNPSTRTRLEQGRHRQWRW